MNSALIGLPMVGKTTIFNLMTQGNIETSGFLSGKTETNVGMGRIPDQRIDYLVKMFKPRKTTYAQTQFSDVPGLVRGSSLGKGIGNQFLNAVRNVDLLIHVVRAFENSDVPHVDESIDPVRDIETVDLELLFADLETMEKRIERIENGRKVPKEAMVELALLRRCYEALEGNQRIHQLTFSEEEQVLMNNNFTFFTEKPVLLVVNVDEDQFRSGNYPGKEGLEAYAVEKGLQVLVICGKMEMEIAQLPQEDRELFMADLGITESGIDRLAKASYGSLGLISFLTSGEDEVRAWTIRKDLDAKRAAGKIHSDIERGFIRAEVVPFVGLQTAGSMAKAREQGLFRLEGKEYLVQDGDIINFRFNV